MTIEVHRLPATSQAVLNYLGEHGATSMRRLAADLGRTRQTVIRHLGVLAGQHLATRTPGGWVATRELWQVRPPRGAVPLDHRAAVAIAECLRAGATIDQVRGVLQAAPKLVAEGRGSAAYYGPQMFRGKVWARWVAAWEATTVQPTEPAPANALPAAPPVDEWAKALEAASGEVLNHFRLAFIANNALQAIAWTWPELDGQTAMERAADLDLAKLRAGLPRPGESMTRQALASLVASLLEGAAPAALPEATPTAPEAYLQLYGPDGRDAVTLYLGECTEIMARLPAESVDVIFADPPYFLSNGGSTCRSGQRVAVDKGAWDRSSGPAADFAFHVRWLAACQRLLRPNGTIWVSGTTHAILAVGHAMQQQGFKILNSIVWEKPNPPPNLSCRYFTHSAETLLWAARDHKARHHFDYDQMRQDNGGKQMKSVWRLSAPGKREKAQGQHPTQKPLALLERVLAASCPTGGVVLDPFNGSGTTGVVARRRGHTYIGIDQESSYLDLTGRRLEE